jgi:hypothetical protein
VDKVSIQTRYMHRLDEVGSNELLEAFLRRGNQLARHLHEALKAVEAGGVAKDHFT